MRWALLVATLSGLLMLPLRGEDEAAMRVGRARCYAGDADAYAAVPVPASGPRTPSTNAMTEKKPDVAGAVDAALKSLPDCNRGDEDLYELGPDNAPEDPVEKGDCSLLLRLFDEATGAPIRGDVDLWRIDAPANKNWSRGDQRVAFGLGVGVNGAIIEELPAGRYRAVCVRQRREDTMQAPEFDVVGALTRLDLMVRLPRKLEIWLRVFDENGRELKRGTLRHMSWSTHSYDRTPPRTKRRKTASGAVLGVEEWWGGGCGMSSAKPVAAGAQGFFCGEFEEDDLEATAQPHLVFSVAGRTALSVDVDCTAAEDNTYVGVVLPAASLLDQVFLPDGSRVADVPGALVSRSASAVPETIERGSRRVLPILFETDRFWRAFPVDVSVRVKGYERLSFQYCAEHPPEAHVMEPLAPVSKD